MKNVMKRAAALLLCAVLLAGALGGAAFASDSVAPGETRTIGYDGYIDKNGGLWLWGENNSCSAGVDRHITTYVETPTKVMENVVAFSRNDQATIVLKTDGSVWTFGLDYAHGSYASHEPVKMLDDCVAVSITGGYPAFGALKADGSLYTWGDQFGGAVGIDINTPGVDPSWFSHGEDGGEIIVPYKLLDNVKSFTMGFYNGIAVKNDNTVWYWGLDCWHELYPNDWLPLLPPVQLTGLGSMAQYSVDQGWVGAVMNDGSYYFFGFDENNNVIKYKNKVKLMDGVAMVSGMYFDDVYVLKTDGNLYYGLRGKEFVTDNVQWVYQSQSHESFALILKKDGTLYKRENGETTFIAGDVALSGQPFSSITPPEASYAGFRDVAEVDWFAQPVAWAVEKGVTKGTSATTFSPNDTCTVQQILTFLWRSQGEPTPAIDNPFTDVPAGEYYTEAAIWAYEKGLVEGSVFGGKEPCTREMVVTYLWKLAGSPDTIDEEGAYYTYSFSDVSDAELRDIVSWALYNEITNGMSYNPRTARVTFGPEFICTRGQIVTFLYRAKDLI